MLRISLFVLLSGTFFFVVGMERQHLVVPKYFFPKITKDAEAVWNVLVSEKKTDDSPLSLQPFLKELKKTDDQGAISMLFAVYLHESFDIKDDNSRFDPDELLPEVGGTMWDFTEVNIHLPDAKKNIHVANCLANGESVWYDNQARLFAELKWYVMKNKVTLKKNLNKEGLSKEDLINWKRAEILNFILLKPLEISKIESLESFYNLYREQFFNKKGDEINPLSSLRKKMIVAFLKKYRGSLCYNECFSFEPKENDTIKAKKKATLLYTESYFSKIASNSDICRQLIKADEEKLKVLFQKAKEETAEVKTSDEHQADRKTRKRSPEKSLNVGSDHKEKNDVKEDLNFVTMLEKNEQEQEKKSIKEVIKIRPEKLAQLGFMGFVYQQTPRK